MSDIFTVKLDLSGVKNDEKSNQLYLAMADTSKMKMIYEFKLYIQFLFSLGCSVELYHEDVRLPDLEDLRVLSQLDVIQVRPSENVEEKKYEGKELISKSKEDNRKRGDGDRGPMPGGNATNCNYIDSKEYVCHFKYLNAGKIVQAQEVSGFGPHKKAEMSCVPSFPAGNRGCSAVKTPKDNMMRNVCDVQEDNTFRLGEKNRMAENLKLGSHLQNKYYGWCGKPDSNMVTARSHFQESNRKPDLKSGEKPCLLKSSAKFTDVGGVENRPCIPSGEDVNISKNTFKGTTWSPVKYVETNNHDLCDRELPEYQVRSKSCSGSKPDLHSGPFGSHVIPGTVQKPSTSVTANSCAEGNFRRKPLTVDEALKLLTEAAAERSKILPGYNPASHNDKKKEQLRGVCKAFKANPAGGNQNCQKSNFKNQITSRKPGKPMVIPNRPTKAVSCQCHESKQEMKSKVNKKAGIEDKNQGNTLLKGCEKICENQSQKTGNTEKSEAKTRAQDKKMCKVNMSTETGDKSQGKASVKGCEKNGDCHGQKTGNTGEVEGKPGALEFLLECNTTKKKPKGNNPTETGGKSQGKASVKGCEKNGDCHGQKTGNTGEVEGKPGALEFLLECNTTKKKPKGNNPTETGGKSQGKASVKACEKIDENQDGKSKSTGKYQAITEAPNPLLQCEPTQKKKKLKKKAKAKSENKSVIHPLINDCEHFDNSHGNDKIGAMGKTESETAPPNHFVKYENVKSKVVPGDDFCELSNSRSAFLEECLNSAALNEIIKGKEFNGGESAGFEKRPSRKINSSRDDSEPGDRLRCRSPDNPTGVDTSSKSMSVLRFPGKDEKPNSRRDLQMTDPVNTEDEDGASISNSSANSLRGLRFSDGAVAQDAAAYSFLDLKQGKTIALDDTSSKDDNKDKNESHESPGTNEVITLPNIITDNASDEDAKDINVSGDGGQGGFVSSQVQADLTRNNSRDGFRTEGAEALTGVSTGSARVGGTDSDSSGPRSVPTNEVVALPLRIVENVETKESQHFHVPEEAGRAEKVWQFLTSKAGSSGKSEDVGTGNDSGSGAGKKEPPPVVKECVIS